MKLTNRINSIPVAATGVMRTRAQELRAKGLNVINFSAGELDFDTSDVIKEAAVKAIKDGKTNYTDALGLPLLRESIACSLTKRIGVHFSKEEIGVTAGAKQALFNAMLAIIETDDEVIIPVPYWVTFPAQVLLAGGLPVYFDTMISEFQVIPTKLAAAITSKTKAVIINSPNNPSGSVISAENLTGILDLMRKHEFYLIFDECYASLDSEAHPHINPLTLAPDLKHRIVVINSLSKAYAMTGWRVGYIAGSPTIIKAVGKLQGHSTSNVCTVSQHAAIAAFTEDNSIFTKRVKDAILSRRFLVVAALNQIQEISFVEPKGAFYVLLCLKQLINRNYRGCVLKSVDEVVEKILVDQHVALVPGSAFGAPEYARLSYALGEKDILEGVKRIGLFARECSW